MLNSQIGTYLFIHLFQIANKFCIENLQPGQIDIEHDNCLIFFILIKKIIRSLSGL